MEEGLHNSKSEGGGGRVAGTRVNETVERVVQVAMIRTGTKTATVGV